MKGLDWLRCNRPPRTFVDAGGKQYKAADARKGGTRADGKSEYASRALGNYAPEFCEAIAQGIAGVNMERAMKMRELREEPVP